MILEVAIYIHSVVKYWIVVKNTLAGDGIQRDGLVTEEPPVDGLVLRSEGNVVRVEKELELNVEPIAQAAANNEYRFIIRTYSKVTRVNKQLVLIIS